MTTPAWRRRLDAVACDLRREAAGGGGAPVAVRLAAGAAVVNLDGLWA